MKFTEEHYNKLLPLEHYYRTFQKSSTIQHIEPSDIDIIANVQDDLLGTKTNITCPNCVSEALKYVFIQFDKYKLIRENEDIKICERVEVSRKERPRISNQRGS